ncbi:tryptophan synthase subunit alpha [Dryocola clanedunensis]
MSESLRPLAPLDSPALCLLLMAGYGGLEQTRRLLACCVRNGVEIVELCAPFPNAFTDGEVVRNAHSKALARGTVWQDLLPLIREFSSSLHIVALVDYSHVFAREGNAPVLRALKQAGAAAVLPHGLPPRAREAFYATALESGLPVVGTLYLSSPEPVRLRVLAQSGGFIYLVSRFGRSGGSASDSSQIHREIARLKTLTSLPVALGFGLKSPSDVAQAYRQGADIAIIGSRACEVIAQAQAQQECPEAALENYIRYLKRSE